MIDPETKEVRARQRGRAKVMGLLLAAFAVLMFLITISKIRAGLGS